MKKFLLLFVLFVLVSIQTKAAVYADSDSMIVSTTPDSMSFSKDWFQCAITAINDDCRIVIGAPGDTTALNARTPYYLRQNASILIDTQTKLRKIYAYAVNDSCFLSIVGTKTGSR